MLAHPFTFPWPEVLRRPAVLSRGLFLLPTALLALVALPFVYTVTLSEPDLVRMAAAMVYGAARGSYEMAGNHYGLAFSYGYYEILYPLFPRSWFHHPDRVALLINAMGIASGLFCALSGTAYLARLFGRGVGVPAAAIFFLSPMMLPAAFSGHPLIPAAGCLFCGGLLFFQAVRAATRASYAVCWANAAAVLMLGLSLRAEIVLAFPFLWLAMLLDERGRDWRSLAIAAAVLMLSFAMFVELQQLFIVASGKNGSGLATFLRHYMSVAGVARGAFVLTLATGVVTTVAGLYGAWRQRRDARIYLLIVLALPALLFWLPNPQPSRHFFFVSLAAATVLAVWIHRRVKGEVQRVALALAVVIANQVAAEVLYRPIVAAYPWSYPAFERQATQQVPLGGFPFAQRANQRLAAMEHDEASALAARAPAKLLVFADSQHYIIGRLIALDPALRWSERAVNGIVVTFLESPTRTVALVEKYSAWPRDVTAEVLSMPDWRAWPVYVQPTTVSRYDRTRVPAEREFRLH